MSYSEENTFMDDEGAGYLISVSDMMSGLLFVFIITLFAFVINFQDAILRLEITNTALEGNKVMRKDLLKDIQNQLVNEHILVEVDNENGVMRLSENEIQFQQGEDILDEQYLHNLELISAKLASILPCYSANPPQEMIAQGICLDRMVGKIDSIFIEGHTDDKPVNRWTVKRFKNNLELSAFRAIYTYQKMIAFQPVLNELLNSNGQRIFSFSGYGKERPLPGVDPANGRNRRIDIRFIMTPPSKTRPQQVLESGSTGE